MASSLDESEILSAVAPLVAAGFAIHWLRPRSKAPSAAQWSTAPVATIDDLRQTHRSGANVGARFGEHSRTEAGYLHLLDVDVRVAEYADEAWEALAALFPGIDLATFPSVISGSGGASRHVYFVTDKPFSGKLLAVSEGKHRRSKVDAATGERKEGWSYDWEIELYGTGKQAVLPPSIHPDTGKPYAWEREFDLDMLSLGIGPSIPVAMVEALGVTNRTTYEFETRDPLDFKPGQLERELTEIEVSDLPYDDWIRLGQALHHQFGGAEQGWDLWQQHTRRSTKYNGDDRYARKKWQSFGRYRGKPVTMATIRHWVQEARIKDLIEDVDDLFDDEESDPFDGLLDDRPALAPKTPSILDIELNDLLSDHSDAPGAVGVARNVLTYDPEWRSHLQISDDGEIKATLHNVGLIVRNDIRLRGVVAYNQFTQELVQRGLPGRLKLQKASPKPTVQLDGWLWDLPDPLNGKIWSDSHDIAIRAMIEAPKRQGGYSMKVSDRDLHGALDRAAVENGFHPVREYLSDLVWDGESRLERLFVDYLGTPDDDYHRATAAMTMLAAVTRVFRPGFKFDYVPVIEGDQGVRKSTFVKALATREAWFSELEGDFHDTKGMVERMQGAWVLELPELQGFSKAEVTTIKGFVSRTTDKVRMAYAKRAVDFPRQSIIIGTTNDKEYLRDSTGGRRFWPIECRVESIDIDRLKANIDQIWAEAKVRYDEVAATGRGLYLDGASAKQDALRLQESRRTETPEDALAGEIEQWLNTPIAADFEDLDGGAPLVRQETCITQIWKEMLGNDTGKLDARNSQQISRAMQSLRQTWFNAGRKYTKRFGRQRIYRRVVVTSDDERGQL